MHNRIRPTLNLQVLQWRANAGLTQKELAERMGWKTATLSDVEAGVIHLDKSDLARLQAATTMPRGSTNA